MTKEQFAEFEQRFRAQGKWCKGPTVLSRESRIVYYQRWRTVEPYQFRAVLIREVATAVGLALNGTQIPDDPELLYRLFAELVDKRRGCKSIGQVQQVTIYDSGAGYIYGDQLLLVKGNGECCVRVEEVLEGHIKKVAVVSTGEAYRNETTDTTGGSGKGCKLRVKQVDPGYSINDVILSGPLDGEKHSWRCPRCGLEGTYIAPRITVEN